MTGRIVVLKPGKPHEIVTVKEPIRLATMYEQIGCSYVQSIDTPLAGIEMILDEEGKFKEEPEFNGDANHLVGHWLAPGDAVTGTAVLCTTDASGEWRGLSDGQLVLVEVTLGTPRSS